MPKKLDTTTLLGEDAPGSRHSLRAPRSLREAARALVGDDRSDWEWRCDEFEKRLFAAMRSPNRRLGK